jgi:hypothetical protein
MNDEGMVKEERRKENDKNTKKEIQGYKEKKRRVPEKIVWTDSLGDLCLTFVGFGGARIMEGFSLKCRH